MSVCRGAQEVRGGRVPGLGLTLSSTSSCFVGWYPTIRARCGASSLTFELYLPQEWDTDAARRANAGIPDQIRFREKWRMALAHIRRVLKADFQLTAVPRSGHVRRAAPMSRNKVAAHDARTRHRGSV